jgi:DNA-binding response OmpR family regulator
MRAKAKILIVDDEQINLDFFDVMLSKLGFEVEKAEDGEEALEKVVVFKPDLIILDNIMPKLTGWEVTKTLKTKEDFSAFRNIPIIMFSAMDDVKDKIEGYELGIEDYITKPFNFSEVFARIKAVLRHRDYSEQIVRRERRIAVVESLNKSLLYFTQHLRQPVVELFSLTTSLDPSRPQDVREFLTKVKTETETVLAAIDGLKEEILELQTKESSLRNSEISLEELEKKYQKHFNSWKERQENLQGAER